MKKRVFKKKLKRVNPELYRDLRVFLVKEKAWERYLRNFKRDNFNLSLFERHCHKQNIIQVSFTWAFSYEGDYYWRRIYAKALKC